MRKTILYILIFITISVFAQQKTPKIGLALSGGGAKGLAHIGVIKVLEKYGIKPDYIAGTSMGSIVGAFYSAGYSAEQMEEIVKTLDWDKLISDELSRRTLSFVEKEESEKYLIEIPIKKNKNNKLNVVFPGGLHQGFNIYNEMSRLLAPVSGIKDFTKLPIPFVCIATDIEHGKAKVLKSGNLPKALRASMSIPSVFTPVEINDTLLVDGGLLDNFPVMALKKMGADIIIGIDVQDTLYTKDQLHSVINVLDQASKFLRASNNQKARENTDLYFQPNVNKFGVLDFDKADTIIKLGEKCANSREAEIVDFIKKYHLKKLPAQTNLIKNDSTLKLKMSVLKGLKRVPKSMVFGQLKIKPGDDINTKTVSDAVLRLYGTGYFNQIYYDIKKLKHDSCELDLDFVEKYSRNFQIGLNYNSELGIGLLLGYTAKNLIFNGDRYSTEIKIGQESYIKNRFLIDKGWIPGIGVDLDVVTKRLFYYNYNEKPVFTLGMANLLMKAYTQMNFFRTAQIGGGIEFEGVRLENEYALIEDFEYKKRYLNVYAFVKADYLDNYYFPTSGMYFRGTAKIINQFDYNELRFFFKANLRFAIPVISNKVTLIPQIYTGTLVGQDLPLEYYFYSGGYNNQYYKGIQPFVGLQYNEYISASSAIARADVRYNFIKNHYLTFTANFGSFAPKFEDMIKNDKKEYLRAGFGLKYSIKTIVGPLEFAIYESDLHHNPGFYLNLGYIF